MIGRGGVAAWLGDCGFLPVSAHELRTSYGHLKTARDQLDRAPSGSVSVEHVRNVMARLNNPATPAQAQTSLRLTQALKADTARCDRPRPTHQDPLDGREGAMRETSIDVQAQLKALRLHVMAAVCGPI